MKLLVVFAATLACSLAKPGLLGSTISTYSALGSISTPLGASIAAPLAAAPISTTVTDIVSPVATRIGVAPIAAAPISTTVTELATPIAAAPITRVIAPLAAPIATHLAPVTPALNGHTKYHAQDVIGQANYGHNEALQAHHAVQDAAGNKIGSFSYVSPDGTILRTDYVADGLGYRVASNALPVGPTAPVADTAEVIAAKAAHIAAHEAAKSRVRRQILATPIALGHTSTVISPVPAHIAALAIGHTPAATAPLAHTLII